MTSTGPTSTCFSLPFRGESSRGEASECVGEAGGVPISLVDAFGPGRKEIATSR